jgi:hypothetical protein
MTGISAVIPVARSKVSGTVITIDLFDDRPHAALVTTC